MNHLCKLIFTAFLYSDFNLCILKPALLPQTNPQSPDVFTYLAIEYVTSWMSVCTNLATFIQIKKFTFGECTFIEDQL